MPTNEVLKSSKARLASLRKKLQASEDFREFEFLQQFVDTYPDFLTNGEKAPATKPRPGKTRKVESSADASLRILEDKGHPVLGRELVGTLPTYGKTVGGKQPVTNLASTLSKDNRFVSVQWGGVKCWWINGRDLPSHVVASTRKGSADNEAAGGSETDPAAPPSSDQGDYRGAALAS